MPKINRAADYSEAQIKTAGKLKSLQMLHDGAVRFLKESLEDPKIKTENIIKAQNIIAQLQMCLRFDEGDMAELLFYLYDYMYIRLENHDNKSISDVLELFEHLLQSLKMMGLKRAQAA